MSLLKKNKLEWLCLLIVSYSFFNVTAFASLHYEVGFINQTKKEVKLTYQSAKQSCVYLDNTKTIMLPHPRSLKWEDEVEGYFNLAFTKSFSCNPSKSPALFDIAIKNNDGSVISLATIIIRPKLVTHNKYNVITQKWGPSMEIQKSTAYNPKDIVVESFLGMSSQNADEMVYIHDASTHV